MYRKTFRIIQNCFLPTILVIYALPVVNLNLKMGHWDFLTSETIRWLLVNISALFLCCRVLIYPGRAIAILLLTFLFYNAPKTDTIRTNPQIEYAAASQNNNKSNTYADLRIDLQQQISTHWTRGYYLCIINTTTTTDAHVAQFNQIQSTAISEVIKETILKLPISSEASQTAIIKNLENIRTATFEPNSNEQKIKNLKSQELLNYGHFIYKTLAPLDISCTQVAEFLKASFPNTLPEWVGQNFTKKVRNRNQNNYFRQKNKKR